MITQVGLICGEILELLEKRNGISVYGEIHSDLKQPRDLVMMGLGWLLCRGYIQILEDPIRNCYRNTQDVFTTEASLFDLVVENRVAYGHSRIKNVAKNIRLVADEILVLLKGCGDLTDIKMLELNLRAHRDIVLMSLGWLIREGYVRGIAGTNEIFICRLHRDTADVFLKEFCFA